MSEFDEDRFIRMRVSEWEDGRARMKELESAMKRIAEIASAPQVSARDMARVRDIAQKAQEA